MKNKTVFSNKNFTLVFLGALVSNIAALFYSFAVSFFILKLSGNNAFLQGLYLALGGVVYCVVALFGGVISDRFNKAKIMYICDYLKGGIIIVFTLLLMFVIKSDTAKIVSLFVITVLLNAIAGIFTPASSAILPLIVEEDKYQQAQSYFSILNSFQSIVGIVLAGILYTLIPIDYLFLIVGVFYIGSAISEMFIKYKSEIENSDEKLNMKIVFGDIKQGFKYLVAQRAVFIFMICVLFINFFFSPVFENFAPYFVETDIASSEYMFKSSMEPEMWNSFFGVAVGLGSLIMGIVVSMLPQKEKCNKTVRYAMMGVSIAMIVMAIGYVLFKGNTININITLIITIVVLFAIGSLLVLINVPSTAKMMVLIDKDKFGKVSAVSTIGSQGLIPLSMLLGGIVITSLGSSGLLVISSVGILVTSLILFFSKSFREM